MLHAPFKVLVKVLSPVPLCGTPWTMAHQAPLFMGFPRQEYCSGLPFPSPGHLFDLGIKPRCPELQVDSSPLSHPGILTGCLQKGNNAAGFSNTGVAWVRTLSLPPHRLMQVLGA